VTRRQRKSARFKKVAKTVAKLKKAKKSYMKGLIKRPKHPNETTLKP